MPTALRRSAARSGIAALVGVASAVITAGVGLVLVALWTERGASPGPACGAAPGPSAGAIALGAPGAGQAVGATEYGGPGDPSSGTVGASGVSLVAHPDSYAELGGVTFQTATAMGGLAYMTPLRVTWGRRSAVAYKRDFGLGGGPVAGRPRVIDLWWQFATALGIPYDDGRWSGDVRIARAAASGASDVLSPATPSPASRSPGGPSWAGCLRGAGAPGSDAGAVAITSGPRAQLLPGGLAAAPAAAPAAVTAMIAAGNEIAGKPYVYGAAHGLPLDQVAPAYDCSSSVEHLLYGARLLPVTDGAASGALEAFGAPGPGRWVTIYASADHVFMYVAGLRWDTWNAAGPQDGATGIGWHPLVRSAAGFVARHPVGL